MPSTRYKEITIVGSPREMGEQLGEAAGELVRGFCEVALERLETTMNVGADKAQELAEISIPLAEGYQPDYVEEIRGLADAADLPLWKVMLLQVRNQFTKEQDAGCTSLSLPANAERGPVVAQNWDNDPELDAFTIVLTRKPTGKPALMTVTQAGLIAYIGFNDCGFGACLNTLPAPSRPQGVPHYFTLRGLYESDSLEAATEAIRKADRAIPANIMLATPQGPANFEVMVDDVYIIRPQERDWIAHTNHCLHEATCQYNEQFPELIGSHPRKQQIDSLLSAENASIQLDDIKAALSDHAGHPRSICRHENDDAQTGFWKTVFSVIIEPEQQQMHITRGTPCNMPYETYQLNGK